jgi:riboflavin synthase
MFTGLILGMGQIGSVEKKGKETRLGVKTLFSLPDIALGESIAVNGACLTVETFTKNAFTAYASAETMSRTSLGGLAIGSKVNLERALAMGDRLGGHMVSGHVDCLAKVESVVPAGESKLYRLSFPEAYSALVVEKGSVALDGISLTVNATGPGFLTVNIIPETQKSTTIAAWKPGTTVNLETDVIGKYVQQMLAPYAGGASAKAAPGGLDEGFFRSHGF